MEKLRIAIVDDERLARERIVALLETEADVEVVLNTHDPESAARGVIDDRPDALFLDIQMPVRNGFAIARQLLDRLGEADMPVIVFVTGYADQALAAFEVRALDYLVKPFDDDRFYDVLARVRERIRQRRLDRATGRLRRVLDSLDPAEPHASAAPEAGAGQLERIVLRLNDRVRLVAARDIDWIASEGIYARLHIGTSSALIRMPMHELEARLDPKTFARIHRSAIVNLDRVSELREQFRGDFTVVLRDGTELKLSRSRKAHLEALLGQSL